MYRTDRAGSRRTVEMVVASVLVLGGAVAVGTLLWNALGVMSTPIDLVAPFVLVRIFRPLWFRPRPAPD